MKLWKNFLRSLFCGLLCAALIAGSAAAAEYIEGEALVVLKGAPGVAPRTQAAVQAIAFRAADSAGGKVATLHGRLTSASDKVFALIRSDTKTTEQLIADLKENPDVLAASPNRAIKSLSAPSEYDGGHQWGLEKIRASAAWDFNSADNWGDRNIKVAVIDTGIDVENAGFIEEGGASNLDRANSVSFVGNSGDFQDKDGHGTHVSGIIGAAIQTSHMDNALGVSPRTSIITLRALEGKKDDGSGVSNVLAAMKRVASLIEEGKPIKAVNLSLGWDYTSAKDPSDLLGSVEYFAFREIDSMPNAPVIVVAAGNNDNGYGYEVGKPHDGVLEAPASFIGLKNMIVVASIGQNDSASRFSYWGSNYVHLAAPGEDIYSTYPYTTYKKMSGTSMAAPFVTGSVALLASKSTFKNASGAELKRALLQSADRKQIAAPGGQNGQLSQFGALDIGNAFSYNELPTPSPITSFSVYVPTALYEGESFYAAAEIQPLDAEMSGTVWGSSDMSIATVDASGLVRAHKTGSVTITARAANGQSSGKSVEVRERPKANEGNEDDSGGCDAGLPVYALFALAIAARFFVRRYARR